MANKRAEPLAKAGHFGAFRRCGDVAAGPRDGNPAHSLKDVSRGQQEREKKRTHPAAAEFRFNFRALV